MKRQKVAAFGAHARLLLIAAGLVLATAGVAASFSVGFLLELNRGLAGGASAIVRTLAVTQAIVIAVLCLTALMLAMLAFRLRANLIVPLENLRRGLNAAAMEQGSPPLFGVERLDEIGAIARAAEKFREAARRARKMPEFDPATLERIADGAARLESDLLRVATAASHARLRIEQAALRTARASHTAVEAAAMAREGAAKLTQRAEEKIDSIGEQSRTVIDALAETARQLSRAAGRLEQGTLDTSRRSASSRKEPDAVAVLEELASGLDALERFTKNRPKIANDQLLALSGTLLMAGNRLNRVAIDLSEFAGDPRIHAAE